MFYVGRAENLVAIFSEQNPDHQTNSQVTIFISTGREGHVGNLLLTFQQLLQSGKTRQGAARSFHPRAAKGTFTRVTHTISHSRLNVIKEVRINSMILRRICYCSRNKKAR